MSLAQSGWMTEDGVWLADEGKFKILRSPIPANEFTKEPGDPNYVAFGNCTERYHPLQPREVAQRFDSMVRQPAETMAFLGEGEDMFISWKMPSIEVIPNDVLDMYGIIRGGFDTAHGWKLFTASVRPVCWNTISQAQGWADPNTNKESMRGNVWKGRATSESLIDDLGYWMQFLQQSAEAEVETTKLFFQALAEQALNDETAEALVALAYPYKGFDAFSRVPPELRAREGQKIEDFNASQRKIREGILSLWNGQGTAITPNMWGLLNCTSEFVCHYMPSKKPIAESVMFGNRNSITGNMIEVLKNQIS